MDQTSLEAIRGGGGSIKVGTTGTISSLVSRELVSSKSSSSKAPLPSTSLSKSSIDTTPRKLKSRVSRDDDDEASSSGTSNVKNNIIKNAETPRKTKHYPKSTHHRIPILEADNISIDGTPVVRTAKRGVEIVDIKCGKSDKNWANPIKTRLKKLGFSKLSDSVG